MIEVRDKLFRSEEKQGELEAFFMNSSAEQLEEGTVKYGEGANLVVFRYSKKGRIESIKCGAEYADQLEFEIENAIYKDYGSAIANKTIFTNLRVNGYFRYLDQFQIIPMPDNAPKLNVELGDHPALLEFSYSKSTNAYVEFFRRDEKLEEILNMISAFTFGGVRWMDNVLKTHWVLLRPPLVAEQQYCNLQEQYGFAEWELKDELGFTCINAMSKIELVEYGEYFNQLGLKIGTSFNLPSNIDDLIKKYQTLPEDVVQNARLSIYWLHKSKLAYRNSASLSFSALIFALESLLPPPKVESTCCECKQSIYSKSIGEAFRNLIESSTPGIERKLVNSIYTLRSIIAHGSGIMHADKPGSKFHFTDQGIQSDQKYRQTRLLCQFVILNWILAQ